MAFLRPRPAESVWCGCRVGSADSFAFVAFWGVGSGERTRTTPNESERSRTNSRPPSAAQAEPPPQQPWNDENGSPRPDQGSGRCRGCFVGSAVRTMDKLWSAQQTLQDRHSDPTPGFWQLRTLRYPERKIETRAQPIRKGAYADRSAES